MLGSSRHAVAVILVLIAAALLQLLSLLETRAVDREMPTAREVEVVDLVSSAERRRVVQFFGNRCGILAFFHSKCPGCNKVAPEWSGKSVVDVGGTLLPVVWIAVAPDDQDATKFLKDYNLSRPGYRFQSRSDRRVLGIRHWPQMAIVGQGDKLVSQPGPRPADLVEVPAACIDNQG